jgi:hypothetical protein
LSREGMTTFPPQSDAPLGSSQLAEASGHSEIGGVFAKTSN